MSDERHENDAEAQVDPDVATKEDEPEPKDDATTQEDVAVQEETSDAAANAENMQDQAAEETADSASEESAKADEDASAARSDHDTRVAAFAEALAALIEKGEEVVSGLEAKAEDTDTSFGKHAAKANEHIDNFSAIMEQRFEQAAKQFSHDLEVIASTLNKKKQADAEAECEGRYEAVLTPAAKEYRKRMGVGIESDLSVTDPELVERFSNFAFDDVTSDVDMPDRTRFMCWLATLLGCQGVDEYRKLLPAALKMGVEPETAKEIVYQAVAYLGMGRVYPFLEVTNEVFWREGIELPLKPQATTAPDEESRYAGGEEAQVACFGEQMRGYKDRGAEDYPHIAQWLVKNCFGDWYTRGGLTIAEREMCTFCYIAAQGGCEAQLKAHTTANVHCGNDREFLIKVVSNNVPFIGYPRSLNAMAVVEEVTGATEE